MRHNYMLLTLTIIFGLPVVAFGSITPFDSPPPVPNQVLVNIQEAIHPFMMATRDQFRDAEDRMSDDLYYQRSKDFEKRVESYISPNSNWYVGDGPLQENENFHPRLLRGEDAKFYTQLMIEVMAYNGFNPERWAINRLKFEFQRLLDEIEAGEMKNIIGWKPPSFNLQDARLLALASLTYDIVYNRFETVDRHGLNRRLKQARDRLAEYCATINPAELSPVERTTYGTALGLSTMMCVSVYEFEWKRENKFSVQTFLPDLYRAITLTRQGMETLVTKDFRIHATLDELETTLLIAIPWVECIKQMGYTLILRGGNYALMYRAIQSHKLPGSANVVVPYIEERLRGPWIPQIEPLYWEINTVMYDDPVFGPPQAIETLDANPEGLEKKQDVFGMPDRLVEKIERVEGGTEPMSLREMLERFEIPKRQPAEPEIAEVTDPNQTPEEAGWTHPEGLKLPPMWGGLYQLAAIDIPASGAQDAWEAWGPDLDSHPYPYLYQRPTQAGFQPKTEQVTLLQYPDWNFSMLAMDSYRDPFVLASQRANNTIATATYALDHESFLLTESGTQWRWMHEAPADIQAAQQSPLPFQSVDKTSDQVFIEQNKKVEFEQPEKMPSLVTSLFTAWEGYSTHGKTLMLRRHLSGVGGAYTVVAHYPNADSEDGNIKNIVFSTPGEESDVMRSTDNPELIRIIPQSASTYRAPADYYEWQQIRRMERSGDIEPAHSGILQVFFSPNTIAKANFQDGVFGKVFDIELANPQNPFFYIIGLEQPGRELYQSKYGNLPIDGVRMVEWQQGIDLVAVTDGTELENPFVHTDAELAIVIRDRSMKGLFYLMLNGTYLRAKFSATQEDYLMLADTKGKRTSIAWSQRRLYATEPPNVESRFYAPDVVGFVCPGNVINYGRKARQAVVWGSEEKTLP